jgi:2-polyprenyl-6-methoxyphenol hydroxylase-like FAD-dependent oxidoreductase
MDIQERKCDVLIVGAGPVGLMMACRLVMHDINFRIIDKSANFSPYSGALIVHAGTLELLRQLGISDAAVNQGTILKSVYFSFFGRRPLRIDISHIGRRQSEFPFALMIEQGKTEKILSDFLTDHGIIIERESLLTDFTEYSDHVESYISNNHAEEKITSSYLIAADGGHSFIRSKLGIPLAGTTRKRSLFAMDCTSTLKIAPNGALFAFSGGATSGFFPLSDGKWRIDGAFEWPEKNATMTFRDVQENFKRKTKQNIVISDASWFSMFQSQRRNAVLFNTERCFLIGDAAHQFSPVGAQGMNHGMQDAANLSWKLAFAIKKWTKPCILYSYETERKQIAVKTAQVSDLLFDFLSTDRFFTKSFRIYVLPFLIKILSYVIKLPVVSKFVFRKISGIGISYRNNLALYNTSNHKGPRHGERMPYAMHLQDGKAINFTDIIRPARMHLLVFCREGNSDDYRSQSEKFRQKIDFHSFQYNEGTKLLFEQLKIKKTTFYVVRPDLYIACSGNGPEELAKFLRDVLLPD